MHPWIWTKYKRDENWKYNHVSSEMDFEYKLQVKRMEIL